MWTTAPGIDAVSSMSITLLEGRRDDVVTSHPRATERRLTNSALGITHRLRRSQVATAVYAGKHPS
jgi:hypothetical protein